MAARLLLVLLLGAWCAPAALASYVSPQQHACCRRGGHHCPDSPEQSFREGKLHCRMCQGVVGAQKAPRLGAAPTAIAPADEHPFIHEFRSAFPSPPETREQTSRAPPLSSTR